MCTEQHSLHREPVVSFIEIDAEGMETDVLEGLRATILRRAREIFIDCSLQRDRRHHATEMLPSDTPQNPPGSTTIVGRSGSVARDSISVGESLNRTA